MKNKFLVTCLVSSLTTSIFANDIKLTGEFSELYGNPFMKIIKENKTNTVNICSQSGTIKLPVESNLDNTNFMSQIKHKNSYIIDNKTVENVLEDYFSEDNNIKKSCGEYEVNIKSGKIILTYTDFENNQLEILQKVEVSLQVELINNKTGFKKVENITMDNTLGRKGDNYNWSITTDINLKIEQLEKTIQKIIETEIYTVIKGF
jgi:hypothetical protein